MVSDRHEARRQAEVYAAQARDLGPSEARALYETVTGLRRPSRFREDALAAVEPAWVGFAQEYARYRRFASAPSFTREPGAARTQPGRTCGRSTP